MKSYNKYLKEVFDDDIVDFYDRGVEIGLPFYLKNNILFLGNGSADDKKIASLNFDNNMQLKGHNIIDDDFRDVKHYVDEIVGDFYEEIQNSEGNENIFKELEEPKMIPIEEFTVRNIESDEDSQIDGAGDEYSYLYSEKFDVYFGNVNVTNYLNEKDLKKIADSISDDLNKDYKPKFFGTHRTY